MAPCRVSVDLPAPVQAERKGGMHTTNSIKKINSPLSIHVISFFHTLDPTFTSQHRYIFFHPFYILHLELCWWLRKAFLKVREVVGFLCLLDQGNLGNTKMINPSSKEY